MFIKQKDYEQAVKYYKITLQYVGNSKEEVEIKKSIYYNLVKEYSALQQYNEVDKNIKNVMKYMEEDKEKAEIYKMVADNCYKAVLL